MTTSISTPMQVKKPVILIMTSYFLMDHKGIGGGIGERYVGLYGNFVKNYSNIYNIFWYSVGDSTLRSLDSNGHVENSVSMPMPAAILKVLAETVKGRIHKKPLFTPIISYHYAFSTKMLGSLLSLLLLHVLRVLGVAKVVIDIVDPPVEVHITYYHSPSKRKTILGTILDILTLKRGTVLITVTNSYKKYLTRKYGISSHRVHVLYNASFPDLIRPRPPKAEGPLTIFYSGSLLNIKDIPQLIKSLDELRMRDIGISLLLTGGNIEAKDKPWVKSIFVPDWFRWIDILSKQADICVIPYPRRIHWDFTHHCKLSDYMAAGKPVVSMYGTETALILRKYVCGLTARTWEEFKDHIVTLYNNREFARTLGNNGRSAVERYFNYVERAKILHNIVAELQI